MLSPPEMLIKQLYHSYRHTADIDRKGLFFSPTCMQICRPIPSYAATSRAGIVKYLKDAQVGDVPVANTSESSEEVREAKKNETTIKRKPVATVQQQAGKNEAPESSCIEKPKSRGVYTIRPLHAAEQEFSVNTITASVGLTPAQLIQRSKDEDWIGMRVDLWTDGAPDEGLLVKVQYWWRKEDAKPGEALEGDEKGKGWRQCLHDIMYLGPKDGSEGEEGLEVLE
ncbi:hypothetical protein FB567DRAFT_318381 [Paraphoma chrysanthemicola]|uniref:SnoaL-like domain-containing protein n=1 Tax=Paraphoma chrysanthemicola TaxID=798071 RepID=A0A8K0VZI4_9PLEO|nr:hypothetical protein FB567DRAFT_318381 [Paraphoma chrysanthemicola]